MRYQICILALGMAASAPSFGVQPGSTASLALLETTDLHSNVLSYDYLKLAPDASFGLERTAALIAQARREFPNTMLLDNGDTIQGSALADYQALVSPLACSRTLAVYKAMNKLGFEGGGIGNHEFNYGLAFLSQVTGNRFDVDGVDPKREKCAGPAFPQVLANVYSVKSKQPLFTPYRIIDKKITALDANGKPFIGVVKVGIIGFTPPTIMNWDKRWLEGKLYTEGIRETAAKYIPEMRARGAELVVAISHGGLDNAPYSATMENGNWYLAQVPGAPIDAMLIGHSHQAFPNPASTIPQFNLPGVDKVKGTVHGVPTVMANLWGKHLGVVALQLSHDGKKWNVVRERTKVEVRAAGAAVDPSIAELVEEEHQETISYVKTPVGETDFRMSTYFADVGDQTAIQVVNMAQVDYVRKYIATALPQYASLPVLSMSAAFKTGAAGAKDYTDVRSGPLALNNAADLYLYPNALYAVKIDGAGLKAWLEKSAERFNTIDPAKKEEQDLINPAAAGYNFDTLTAPEVRYEIDVTRPPGQRIVVLTYEGKPVEPAQEFIVATNNYRASGGGNFPGLDGSKTVIAAPDTSREILIDYIRQVKKLSRDSHGNVRSWRFARVASAGPLVFKSAPGMAGVARSAGIANVTQLRPDDGSGKGFAVYRIDLSK
ncbi:MAG: bifunctional 2,3-cyclic-nucleotide 2-phosphodiesterase/3-nucleotidase [Ramlibacter sp.]|nr:bifunctional 2,3-cyclic-nucleotide 2-phosphodiesterase/3-nucleotidase [Ramlibacter sp.]